MEAGRRSVAVANRKIDVFTREVDMVGRRADPQIDFGMDFGEAVEPVDEPLRGKIRGGADGEHAAALALQQALGPVADAVESVAHHDEISTSRLGDHKPLSLAVEKF